jgi:hypothetical protein
MAEGDRCRGTKRSGEPCTLPAKGSSGFCWAHNPKHAEVRSRNASKAAKAKAPSSEIDEIKTTLRKLMDGVVEGKHDKGRVSVAATVAGVLVRYLELERRVKETDELSRELEEVKKLVESSAGRDRRWG